MRTALAAGKLENAVEVLCELGGYLHLGAADQALKVAAQAGRVDLIERLLRAGYRVGALEIRQRMHLLSCPCHGMTAWL